MRAAALPMAMMAAHRHAHAHVPREGGGFSAAVAVNAPLYHAKQASCIQALYTLGKMQVESGQYAEAVQTYRQALSLDPECADTWNSLGRILRELGAEENAFTSNDYTAYYQVLARDRLPVAFELEADRLASLRLPPEEFEREIEVIKEEVRFQSAQNFLQISA